MNQRYIHNISRRTFLQGSSIAAFTRCAQAATVVERSAEDFLDSVGVNVHISSDPYASRFHEVLSLLKTSGIRHVRDELRASNDLARWRRLYEEHGVKVNLLVSPATNTVREASDYINSVGLESISAIEGQNEGDSDWFMAQPVAKPNWSAAVVAYQRDIYQSLRRRYGLDRLIVISPSIIDYKPADVALIRAAAPYCDAVAIHSYVQHGQEPETSDDYASLDWYLAHMRDAFKPKSPVYCTEAGFCNLVRPGENGFSETASAIYIPRLLMNNFSSGVRRTFLYELMNGGTNSEDGEHNWGLAHVDGRPKPALIAVQALMRALNEPMDTESVDPIRIEIVNPLADLRVVKLLRRDGSVMMVLWRAVRCWDSSAAADIEISSLPQTLISSRPLRRIDTLVVSERTGWLKRSSKPGPITIPVGPRLTIVWLA